VHGNEQKNLAEEVNLSDEEIPTIRNHKERIIRMAEKSDLVTFKYNVI
jgi:hypothetical protein